MTRRAYEVRLRGTLGPAARQAFVDLDIDVEPPTTVLSGELDQADLHALFDLVRASPRTRRDHADRRARRHLSSRRHVRVAVPVVGDTIAEAVGGRDLRER